MPFVKGQSGNPAGRRKGALGKDKAALRDLVESKFPGWDPVIAMAEIATTTMDPELRLAACKEVAQYIHAKLRSTEVTGEVTQTHVTFIDAPARN